MKFLSLSGQAEIKTGACEANRNDQLGFIFFRFKARLGQLHEVLLVGAAIQKRDAQFL